MLPAERRLWTRGEKLALVEATSHPSTGSNVGWGRTLVTDFSAGKKNVKFNIFNIEKSSSRPRDNAGGLDWLRQERPINIYFCLQQEHSRGDNIHRPALNTVGDVQIKQPMKLHVHATLLPLR